jgi:hypothetical protein
MNSNNDQQLPQRRGTGAHSALAITRFAPAFIAGLLLSDLASASMQSAFAAADTAGDARPLVFQGCLIYTNHLVPSHDTKRFEFSFERSGCTWRIKSGSELRRIGYMESGFDGTNIYSFTYWNTEPVEQVRAKSNLSYFVTGEIRPHLVPDSDLVWSRHIWFALMPYSCPPMVTLQACDLVTGAKVITNCNRIMFPSFYRLGSYVTNAVVWSEGNDVLDDGTVVALAPPFDKGFTNLTFASSVVEWPVSNIEAPRAFEYHVFGPIGKEPTPLWSLYGRVTNVLIESEFNPLPEIVDKTYVIDSRSAYLGAKKIIHYIATDRWLQPGDLEFKKLIDSGISAAGVSRRRVLVRCLVLAFAAGGLVAVFSILVYRRNAAPNIESTGQDFSPGEH